ncbi:glycosyltransferase [Sphingomonas sp. IW22]|uniref:glycosyltransferase n=1 Tax=Sphingomonas sp. IW22 TaxID=3242489 RepID=UPI003520883E
MPHFTVVLCSHNGRRFIAAQIRSIFEQTRQVDAVHVHDFGSRDDTRAIVEAMAGTYDGRLTLTRHEAAPGPAASFLSALRLTLPMLPEDGLILFADQDDVWLPHKIASLDQSIAASAISTADPVLIFHDVQVVDTNLKQIRPTYYSGNPFRVPRDLDPVRVMMANPAIGHTMMLSRSLAQQILDWPNASDYLMHDWMAVLIASRTGRIHFVDQRLSLYRQHDSNVLGAYRSGRRVAPLPRLMRFVDRQTRQAMSFSHAAAELRHRTVGQGAAVRLESRCRHGYRSAALALGLAAFRHGPTWQRKAIGALLIARSIAGPISDGQSKGKL